MLLLTGYVMLIVEAFAGCVLVWAWAAMRRQRGLPVLGYWPRRPVPWGGLDVVLVVLADFLISAIAVLVAGRLLTPDLTQPVPAAGDGQAAAAHPVTKLIADGSPWMLLVAGLVAVVVAPIVEEFLFRVLLQGWLEAAQRRLRVRLPVLRRFLRGAVGPITLTSMVFAWAHFRTTTHTYHAQYIMAFLMAQAIAGLLTVGYAIGLVRLRVGAKASDLGWASQHFWGDVRRGLLAFLALGPPLYLLQIGLSLLLRRWLVADPIPLFFFALALGTLYHRTHRIVPSIVLHMSLNFTSLLMAWLPTLK